MTAGAILAISRVKKEKAWPSLASRPVRPTLHAGQRSSSRAERRLRTGLWKVKVW